MIQAFSSSNELIKISVLETAPANARVLGEEIANLTNSSLVQTIGNKITLYKKRKKNSKIDIDNIQFFDRFTDDRC